MKKLLTIFLGILLLAGCAETYDGPTEEVPMLTEYTVTQIYDIPGWEGEQHTSSATYTYDIYGNRVKTMSYDEGELAEVVNMRYDDRGNVIEETRWDHSGWIPYIDRRVKRTYDEKDRQLTYTSYNMFGVEQDRSSRTYDDEDRTSTFEGSMDRIVYYYDENGLLLHSVGTGAAGTSETFHTYDAAGNSIGWTETLNGEPFGRGEAGYDDQNRLIWSKQYNEQDALYQHITYTYDDEAHTMTTQAKDGDIRIEYYTADGRISLIEDYNDEGELTMYQQYDYRDIRVPTKEE